MPINCDFYDFEILRGDTWDGADFTVTVNGIPLDLTGAVIRMGFGKKPGVEEFYLTSPGDITITGALTGQFSVEPYIFETAGIYFHEIQITLGSGVVKTYIKGKATIRLDITQ